jgi:hypothetical protein
VLGAQKGLSQWLEMAGEKVGTAKDASKQQKKGIDMDR